MTLPILTVTIGNQPPSNLAVVMQRFVQLMGQAGDPTPILVGKNYLEDHNSVGNAPAIVLVPEPRDGPGALTDATQTGLPASQIHVLDVHVRSLEPGDDIFRWGNVYSLNDRMVSAMKRAGAGYLKPAGPCKDDSPIGADGLGAGLVSRFTFRRDIVDDPAIYAVPASIPTNPNPPFPYPPPGANAKTVNLVVNSIAPTT